MQTCIRAILVTITVLFTGVPAAISAEARVAVAANFLTTARALEARFEAESGHGIVLSHGSTGRLYAQIVNGAPFSVFLSADAERPNRLSEAGLAVRQETYAFGRLALVERRPEPETEIGIRLRTRRLALADPAVAPYGVAAVEALASFGLQLSDTDAVLGDSVGQTATIYETGNVAMAFIAVAQLPMLSIAHPLMDPGKLPPGAGPVAWDMTGRHRPIRQDAVLLARGAENPAAVAFFAFLASAEGREVIAGAGYGVPE